MPRVVLHSLTLGEGRGPALRSVEAVIRAGKVAAIAIARDHDQRGSVAPSGFRQIDPHTSPRLFAVIAEAVMREAGARIGG